MTVLKQIDERVSQLLVKASYIMSIKDTLFDMLGKVGDSGGQFTFVETKIAYTRAREINELYRAWYAEAWYLVKSNLPERLEEFETAYAGAAFQLGDMMDEHAILNRSTLALFEKCFSPQIGFIRAIPPAIGSKALGLRGILARDLMDDELSAARHLLDNGYVREAGVIGGVVLERHLKLLCDKNSVTIGDRDTLGQLNDKLRKHYPDDSEYRRVQFLNEIRISCAHDKTTVPPDPTKVGQLLSGVQGFIATIT
jgi:hypothetical protein